MYPKACHGVVLTLIISFCDCLNILAIFPHSGRSHFDVFQPMLVEISKRGHNLTVISHHRDGSKNNWRDVILDGEVKQHIIEIGLFKGYEVEKFIAPHFLSHLAHESDEIALQTRGLHSFLKENNTFDVLLVEYFNSYSFMGVVKKFKAPVVALSSCIPMPWSNIWFATPDNPAYVPVVFMGASDRMTFFERVENTVALIYNHLLYYFTMEIPSNKKSIKYLNEDIFEDPDIMYKTSLMISNTHFTLNTPKPASPNFIEVSGIHIGTSKRLPAELEKWVNESTNGVIYFSLGSMIKGHTLPDEKRQAFLRAFARFPQRVLWKWENESMPDKPDNVMIKKWMPQFDILAHPNVKAFISHGGLLGTIEAVHCGVPIIVMPQFGDQHTNAKALEKNGGGVILELADVTEETVYNALKTILDPNFKKQAEDLSARFKDRPLSPMDTAIYWIEYVARHKGAHHLKTAAVGMPLYQYYLLDVFAFLGVILLIHFYLTFVILRLLYRKLFGSKKQETKVKRQ